MPPALPEPLNALQSIHLPQQAVMSLQIGFALVGLLMLSCGCRLFKQFMAILALAWGSLGLAATAATVWPDHQTLMVTGLIVGALVGCLVGYWLWFVGVFVLGLIVGAVLGSPIVALWMPDALVGGVILCGASLAGGIVALLLTRTAMIVGTAFVGAAHIVIAGALLFGLIDLTAMHTRWIEAYDSGQVPFTTAMQAVGLLGTYVGLAVLGMIMQFVFTAGVEEPPEQDDEPLYQPAEPVAPPARHDERTRSDGGTYGRQAAPPVDPDQAPNADEPPAAPNSQAT
jgi:hypothetical protein